MSKFYRVKKDTPLWSKGAIIKCSDGNDAYYPISDLSLRTEDIDSGWHEGAKAVEAKENADFFERVYEVSLLKKASYLTKEAAQQAYSKVYKEKN